MFSTAVKSIEAAIRGSIMEAFGMMYPAAAKPKDKLCATVKTEH